MAKQTQSEDMRKRYEAYGFNTQEIQGDDMQEFLDACNIARERDNGKPQSLLSIPSREKEFRKLRERRKPMAKPAPSMLMPREKDLASRTSDTLFQKRRANISPNINRNCSRILRRWEKTWEGGAKKNPEKGARLRGRHLIRKFRRICSRKSRHFPRTQNWRRARLVASASANRESDAEFNQWQRRSLRLNHELHQGQRRFHS